MVETAARTVAPEGSVGSTPCSSAVTAAASVWLRGSNGPMLGYKHDDHDSLWLFAAWVYMQCTPNERRSVIATCHMQLSGVPLHLVGRTCGRAFPSPRAS